MCRLDAPFRGYALDEKTDPTERFLQALDEYGADGTFRTFLIKHFSENWRGMFRFGVSELEEALSVTQQHTSFAEKAVGFFLASKNTYTFDILFPRPNISSSVKVTWHLFIKDLANTYFLTSSYELYSRLHEKINCNYYSFISIFYEKDFCFSQAFFDDKALTSLQPDIRNEILLDYAHAMSSFNTSSSPRDPQASVSHSIEFLKAWIISDAKAGRLLDEQHRNCLFKQIDQQLQQIGQENFTKTSSEEELNVSYKLLAETTLQELEALYYTNIELSTASEQEINQWALGLDRYFKRSVHKELESTVPNICDQIDAFESEPNKYIVKFCSHLSPLQIETWIHWAVKEDIQSVLRSVDEDKAFFLRFSHSENWVPTEYAEIWKEKFQETYDIQDIEAKLWILSVSSPFKTDDDYRKYGIWWKNLLIDLVKNNDFPDRLIPRWAIISSYKLDQELLVPYIDRSIGMLRAELSNEEKPEHHSQLQRLLEALDRYQPTKALRHRLILMRSSSVPFSDPSISRLMGDDQVIKWYRPIADLANKRLDKEMTTSKRHDQTELECLMSFSCELAKFFLSRLCLRKGEKAIDGKYDASQVIESSPIWRQGYLKALEELGFDLNGKVHKTLHFIEQSDPDEDVRATASESYRSIRRDSKKNYSLEDLKRGIIAAEWWLLICQHRELGSDIDYEGARRTRRLLLRNP